MLKSYIKANYTLYQEWIEKHDNARARRKEIEEETRKQRTQWEDVIDIFNSRFFVIFVLEVKNRTQVMLGEEKLIRLGFVYRDGEDSTEIDKAKLMKVLSTGERKALYILNVIFEIETRRKRGMETLIVVRRQC